MGGRERSDWTERGLTPCEHRKQQERPSSFEANPGKAAVCMAVSASEVEQVGKWRRKSKSSSLWLPGRQKLILEDVPT